MSDLNQMEEHVLDLLPAYALGCLEAEEALQVAAHLQACASCRAELTAYDHVTTLLPLAAEEISPRPEMRERLLREIDEPTEVARRRLALPRRAALGWGALGLALLVALAVANLFLWGRLQALSAPSSTLQTVALLPEASASEATGLMIVGGDGRVGTLVVDHLPVLEEGQQYQLWLIRDGARQDGGVFSVGEDGYGVNYIHAPEPLLSYSAFGITIEPEGGSTGPTGDKVLGADL